MWNKKIMYRVYKYTPLYSFSNSSRIGRPFFVDVKNVPQSILDDFRDT